MPPRSFLRLDANPVRVARRSMRKTIEQITKDANVNWQLWYLTECGCYDRIPPVISQYLADNGYFLLEQDYFEFQTRQRRRFSERFHPDTINALPSAASEGCPLTVYRLSLGVARLGLAKGLCVQPAVLWKVEKRHSKCLPAQLHQALLEFGMREENVNELDDRLEEWYYAG